MRHWPNYYPLTLYFWRIHFFFFLSSSFSLSPSPLLSITLSLLLSLSRSLFLSLSRFLAFSLHLTYLSPHVARAGTRIKNHTYIDRSCSERWSQTSLSAVIRARDEKKHRRAASCRFWTEFMCRRGKRERERE